jgi:peptidoglycan/LPS O-acetylase OafA/YrhL
MEYRREIDGLRALAVLPVILFHAGFQTFSGGFVGVDIFFVISGYLITSIILAELEQGKFSLLNFYERRARRILPALYLVMTVSIPFAWALLSREDLNSFSRSLVAVALFLSNIFFWRDGGYFETVAELKPLLHTWSLAVEEQYYVIFPLFLMFAWKFGKRWIVTIIIFIAFGSLLVANWGVINKPVATFFLLPTRAWELAIGALTAFYSVSSGKVVVPKMVQQGLSLIGFLLITGSIFAFSKETTFNSSR